MLLNVYQRIKSKAFLNISQKVLSYLQPLICGYKMIKVKLGDVFIDEHGFCHISLHNKNTDKMGVSEAEEVCEAIVKVCNGIPHKLFTDARGAMGSIQPGARKTIRNHAGMLKVRLAEAFIVDSLSNKLIANFYIKFDRPPNPTRVFNSAEEAVEWLENQT